MAIYVWLYNMAIYDYIRLYIVIYCYIHTLKYVFGVEDWFFGCQDLFMLVSGLVFLMSGLVFWVSGLVIRRLDLYLGIWTCISVSGLAFECLDVFSGYCILVGTCSVSVYL